MITFRIDDMTCGRCVATLTQALAAVDGDARPTFDLPRHLVSVETTRTDAATLRSAIEAAGYTPVAVEVAASAVARDQAGGCCGCRGQAARTA
jgi:copper chaperone